jgi:hypothetical protein
MDMENVSENVIYSILKKNFTALVGKSCKRIEILRDTKELSSDTRFNLIRDLFKELAYEQMRSVASDISSYSKGVSINVDIHKPNSKK